MKERRNMKMRDAYYHCTEASEKCFKVDFLQKNKLPIFGYPIPKESSVDWSKNEDYFF